ncbi:hypothetical protein HMPREF6745_0812 [Prevotella sp. oral taxon 472 str. F0295]|jgi:hypothetical protein|nr:hypothetical protein [Prevotella sp. oral taxon 472]EEX53698.1 hypothetical protein HMPREF6745_0812 [Prevotella sp. oral taxon 472 str. F0295]
MDNRGGVRPNAGRKKMGKERVVIYVAKDCADYLRAGAMSVGQTLSEFTENVINKAR